MEVISLLQSKNNCLRHFLALSEAFVKEAEGGKLEGITDFEQKRESTLKAIDLFDRKVAESVVLLTENEKTPALIESVKLALNEKERLIQEILKIDLKIISLIEEEKNRLLREMSQDKKSKETISRFKSTWVSESGEGIDKTL